MTMTVKLPLSSDEHPIKVTSHVEPVDRTQAEQVLNFLKKGIPIAAAGPETVFVDKEGNPITDEMRRWLPRKLHVSDKDDGGPYEEVVELEDHYVDSGIPNLANPFVRVKKLNVKYWVE